MRIERTRFSLDWLNQFVGYRFHTLDQGHAFYLLEVRRFEILYERSSGSIGSLTPKAFELAWNRLQSGGEVTLVDLHSFLRAADRFGTNLDASCFAAILAAVDQVRFLSRPIRIFLGGRAGDPGNDYRPEAVAPVGQGWRRSGIGV